MISAASKYLKGVIYLRYLTLSLNVVTILKKYVPRTTPIEIGYTDLAFDINTEINKPKTPKMICIKYGPIISRIKIYGSYSFFAYISNRMKFAAPKIVLNMVIYINAASDLKDIIKFLVTGFASKNSAVFSLSSLDNKLIKSSIAYILPKRVINI
jgi:hypothetical protein